MSVAVALLVWDIAQAQALEFTENKGQWEKRIQFQGDISNGVFMLHKDGYRILLNNPDDVKRITSFYHGATHTGTPGIQPNVTTARTSAENPTAGGGGVGTAGSPAADMVLHSHIYQLRFLNANDTAAITAIPDKPLNSYNNYILGNDPSKWASHCTVYQAVLFKNVYPNVDVRYYTDNGALKYDIIVNPGGDPDKITLQFDGVDKLSLKNEQLSIQTSAGTVNELKPYTYTSGNTGRTDVAAKYVVKGNTLKFRVGQYDKQSTLVIDPTLVFSTFTGSRADNWGYTATYDNQGNLYSGGIVFNNGRGGGGFPVNNGAYQTTFQGGVQGDNAAPNDVAIMKFSANGSQRLYATYLGGNGNEQPHSLIVDNAGELIISGRTSSTNYPTTAPNFGTCGKLDIFLTKLNATGGGLIGSRKIGGADDDGVNIATKYNSNTTNTGAVSTRRNYGDDARSEVLIDNSDNIYLVTQTQSLKETDSASGLFPVTANAFQPKPGGGLQDGVVIKASSDLSTIYACSFLGGTGNDAPFAVALNPANNHVYVAGATASTDFPGIARANAVIGGTYAGGDCDGFVTELNNDCSSLLNSSYFGTSGADLVFGVQFDKLGFPYITGTTTGSWPVSNAAFSQNNGKQFISKLNPNLGTYVYSTVFGKGSALPDISITAFLVDRCENVYVSGWGGGINAAEGYNSNGTTGLTTTADAIIANSPQRDGADFYFFVMKKDAVSQLYGTMFGQNGGVINDHVDGGTSRFDKQGVIYEAICADCNGGGVFPTTPGAWSQTNGALPSFCNLAAIKIAFHLAGIAAGLRATIDGVPNDSSGCVPLTVEFTDTMAMGKTYQWSFGDGSPDTTTVVNSVNHTFTQLGTYLVRLISSDPEACNAADTAYMHIRVRGDKAPVSFAYRKLPPCDSLKYEFRNTSKAPVTRPFTDTSFVWDFGDGNVTPPTGTQIVTHSYTTPGTYNVVLHLIDTSYCNYPDSALKQIRISPTVKAGFETPAAGCYPYTAKFSNTSLAGQQFYWDFGDGTASQEVEPVHAYTQTGTFTIKLLVIDSSACNLKDSISKTIVITPNPTASFTYSPVPPQSNTPVNFMNTSTGAVTYLWEYGDGDTLRTTLHDTTIQHIYEATSIYKACLYASNQYGCTDSACQAISAVVTPLVDVPNAFTPNGDGINDVVMLRGYGIAKLNFRIYNRWGEMVYQATDPKQNSGWNGRYKGTVQPQDVYTYVADVVFYDGSTYQKKGDITLLR
ncbi:PKD domain-containing protein [Deminuibacter soli]|uniref:PKD domain-containing protein n=1 Tax=Deminuibacter soli TaxID=2291815 RepID=A0A3E1NDR6_9BACT|nr:PKD domain-containing protein [Deminuibacter soli]